MSATMFGIAMRQRGYNLFVLGPPGTGKSTTMRRVLAEQAKQEAAPSDLCYVHNFADSYRPTAFQLPAGRGRELRDAMNGLVEECKVRLPRVFEGDEFERQKSRIMEGLGRSQQAEIARFEDAARAQGFAVLRSPMGLSLAPAPRGEPLSNEEFAALPKDKQEEIESRGRSLHQQLDATLHELRKLEREARLLHEKLVREVAASSTHQLTQELRESFAGLAPVEAYLQRVEEDLIAHAEEFRLLAEGKPTPPFLPPPGAFLDTYRVNVVVQRTASEGAPVVVEENPTHANLVGRIEHRFHFGTLVTDFTLIKAGALHRANGGYLVLEAKDLLRSPFAWEALKKALRSRCIRIEEPLDELRFVSTVSLAPEPVPLSVKVLLIGDPSYYYLLYALDEDFRELFKVKVDFDESVPRTPEFERFYAQFVGSACREEGLRHFSCDAVGVLVEEGSRRVADQGRLTSSLGDLLDLVREASFWAERNRHDLVEASDVRQAVVQKVHRSNLLEERIDRMISEGTLLITTRGRTIGQVNGIAVLKIGEHAFGRPSRITARTFVGKPGVIDIEREAKLGGPVHTKGVMILSGFLAGRYARERPLAISASLAFEQHYEEIDGDSASSAELYALLSSLAGIPLSQSLAVTGSVNQLGEVQPVGGINEKLEGFFDACRAQGLDGEQGVLIPEANARHLMLREDVVQAVRQGQFHIYAVSTVDEGLELLSGRKAGVRGGDGKFPDGTLNAEVERALARNLEGMKELSRP